MLAHLLRQCRFNCGQTPCQLLDPLASGRSWRALMLQLPLSVTLTWDHDNIRDHNALHWGRLDPVVAGLIERINQVIG